MVKRGGRICGVPDSRQRGEIAPPQYVGSHGGLTLDYASYLQYRPYSVYARQEALSVRIERETAMLIRTQLT
jgi:hypothetical protein